MINGQIYHWSKKKKKKKKKQDLRDMFSETLLKINLCTNTIWFILKVFDSLALNMSFLQDSFTG